MDIIDSFNKLPIGKYEDILAISKEEGVEEIDKTVAILSVLTGMSEDELIHIPIAEFGELSRKSQFLSADGFNGGRMAKKYIVGKWELYPVTDYRRLETCQYIDFQTYIADMENRMVELLSVILVPKGHRYNEGYDIIELQRDIREQMTVAEGATIVGFFLTLCSKSIVDSLNYSMEMAKGIKDKEKRTEIQERIREQMEALQTGGGGSQM